MGIDMVCGACGKEFDDNRINCPFCEEAADPDDILDFEILELGTDDEDERPEVMLELEEVQRAPDLAAELAKEREAVALEPLELQELSWAVEVLELEEAGEAVEVLEPEEADEAVEVLEPEEVEVAKVAAVEGENAKLVEIQLEPLTDEFAAYEIKIKVKEYNDNELMLKTEDILDILKEDRRRIRAMICFFGAAVGSFFNFWGIGTELLGSIKMGSLFGGYGFGGALGKLCVLAALAGIGLIVVNLTRYAFFGGLVASLLMIMQGVVVIFTSRQPDFAYADVGSMFFDVGFYVTSAFLILALIFLRKINGVGKAEPDAEKSRKKEKGKRAG